MGCPALSLCLMLSTFREAADLPGGRGRILWHVSLTLCGGGVLPAGRESFYSLSNHTPYADSPIPVSVELLPL